MILDIEEIWQSVHRALELCYVLSLSVKLLCVVLIDAVVNFIFDLSAHLSTQIEGLHG